MASKGRSGSSVGSSAGFSLLEVIVATALMGMAVVGLLSLTSQSLSNAARVQEYDRAAMLARSQMNQLLAIDPLPLDTKLEGRFEDFSGPASGWEALITPLEREGDLPLGRSLLTRIDLLIWWEADGRRKTVSLESYRRIERRRPDG